MDQEMAGRQSRTEARKADQDPRWHAVVQRDGSCDGDFFYAVATTGVYCRPSCGARTPRPENVAFYRSASAAERDGYRPCKRCKPTAPSRRETQAALIAKLCRHIDEGDAAPTLEMLAAVAGLSPYHLHRIFKDVTGMTPRAYAVARRAGRARHMLERLPPRGRVTEAIYASGFGGTGHFYAGARAAFGMTPSAYRAHGRGEEIRFAIGQCSLGAILVAATTKGVCAVLLGDTPGPLLEDLQARFKKATLVGGDAAFEKLVAQVVTIVDAPKQGHALPLDLRGTAFQERVWQALREIPPGESATYTEIAKRIGSAGSVRAVGSACGANPVAVLIPCHRVVRQGGALAGYRWGIERKKALLEREQTMNIES